MIENAKNIIKQCGGHSVVAEWLGINVSNVYRMTYPKEKGGTGGIRNIDYQNTILSRAKDQGIDLVRDDFFS